METIEIIVNKDNSEISVQQYEKEYLKNNLEEIILDIKDKNIQMKNIFYKKILGHKTNRKFQKIKIKQDKAGKIVEKEAIRCECGSIARDCKKKFAKPEKIFTHRNICNKNASENKTSLFFVFKLEPKYIKSSKKYIYCFQNDFTKYPENEKLNENDYKYCQYCLEIVKNNRELTKYELVEKFKICAICFKIDNKIDENDKDRFTKCDECENIIHKECIKKTECTCKTKAFFENKITCFKIINKIIYEKYGIKKKKKLNLILPPNSKNFNIVGLLEKVKELKFNDNLSYEIDERLHNLTEYDNIELKEEDKKIYYELKNLTKKGDYNYITIKKDEKQGNVVIANTYIQENTLLCEYTGNVITLQDYYKKLKNKEIEKNDSIMDLVITPFSETSLIICPYSYANLGRFFSGVNNKNKISEAKINVNSVKVLIDGSVHILLFTSENIEKGEILYYNYNADANLYPTDEFQ